MEGVIALAEYDVDSLQERFVSWGFSAAHAARVLAGILCGRRTAGGNMGAARGLEKRTCAKPDMC